jgi:hypothetical protein
MDCVNHPGVDAPYNCFRCHAPICVDCETKLQGSSICRACFAHLRSQIAASYEVETRQVNYMVGLLVGIVGAVVAASVWSQLVMWSSSPSSTWHMEFMAVAVGGGIGYAVRMGAGDKRGRALQQIAAVLALFGILFGYYLIYYRTGQAGELAGPGFGSALIAFPSYLSGKLGVLEWVFLALGVIWAYWIPHVRTVPE